MAMENTRTAFDLARSVVGKKVGERVEQSGVSRTVQGLRALAKTRVYEELHDDLTKIIAQMRVTSTSLDSNTLQQMEQQFTTAVADGTDEERRLAQEQLDALQEIRKLLKGQGDKLAEQVLDRETLTNEEAAETVGYLRELAAKSGVLEQSIRVDTASAMESFMETVADERVSAGFRKELVKTVSDAFQESALFRGGAAAGELRAVAGSPDGLTSAATRQAASALERMRDKLDTAEILNELATAAQDDNVSRRELNETLTTMVSTMGRIDGFAEEQTRISKLMREDLHGDQDRMDELRSILSKVADRTVEAKTLFTLGQLNDKFDAAVLDRAELEESLAKGNLGKEFLENAGNISKGGGGGLLDMISFAALMTGHPLAAVGVQGAGFFGDIAGTAAGVGGAFGLKGLWSKLTGQGASVRTAAGETGEAATETGGNVLQRALNRLPGWRGKAVKWALALGGGFGLYKLLETNDNPTEDDVVKALSEEADTFLFGFGGRPEQTGQTPEQQMPDQPEQTTTPVDVGLPPVGIDTADAALLGAGAGGTALVARNVARNLAPGLELPGGGFLEAPAVDKPAKPAKQPITLKNLAKHARAGGPLGAALGVAFGAQEYMAAEDEAGRKAAVGNATGGAAGAAAGALTGAAVGSIVPFVGTAAGAIIGGIVGGVGGSVLGTEVADWLSGPVDKIPDELKKDVRFEMAYVNHMLAQPDITPEAAEELQKHRQKLLSRGAPKFVRRIEHLYDAAGVPPSMRLAQLQSDLEALPAVYEAAPEIHQAILSNAESSWADGGTALGYRGTPRQKAATRRQDRVLADAYLAKVKADAQATAPDVQATVMSPRQKAAMRRKAAEAGAVVAEAVPEPMALDTGDDAPAMQAGMTEHEIMAQRADLLAAHPPPEAPAAVPAGAEAGTGGKASVTPRPPKVRQGAPAPSTAKDDYSIALINGIMFH